MTSSQSDPRPGQDDTIGGDARDDTLARAQETHYLQPKITGYRQFSKEEVALMNEAKALAELCGVFIEKLHLHANITHGQQAPLEPAAQPPLDHRWISIGATQLQQGWMAVIRGIAQPTTF